jgi:hypothetical protein
MITQQSSARIKNAARPSVLLYKRVRASDRSGRLTQIALALYVMPALLAVLALGGVGMLVLEFGRLLTGPARGSIG